MAATKFAPRLQSLSRPSRRLPSDGRHASGGASGGFSDLRAAQVLAFQPKGKGSQKSSDKEKTYWAAFRLCRFAASADFPDCFEVNPSSLYLTNQVWVVNVSAKSAWPVATLRAVKAEEIDDDSKAVRFLAKGRGNELMPWGSQSPDHFRSRSMLLAGQLRRDLSIIFATNRSALTNGAGPVLTCHPRLCSFGCVSPPSSAPSSDI